MTTGSFVAMKERREDAGYAPSVTSHHDLKAHDGMFTGFMDGSYTSTNRFMKDRNFKENDTITLREGHRETTGFEYSGRTVSFRISAITNFGCVDDVVTLHLKDRNLLVIKYKD